MLAEENPFSMKTHRPQPAPSHALPNIYSKTENPKTQKPPFPPPLCASSTFVTHPHSSALIDISASGLADQNVGNDLRVISDTPMTAPWWERVGRVVPSMDAVVKVFCVHTAPNFSQPRKKQYSSNSSGFMIGGRRVLTNAHSVDHHTQVKLKKRGSDTKYLATVLAIGAECDIAMLTVSDDEFWEGISPVEFGELPALQDAVTVVGYPIGGDTISVTSGVVSRVEILPYVHGSAELLGMQMLQSTMETLVALSLMIKGECVGIAFQFFKQGNAENIGYVIPVPVVMHFIEDYKKNGAYTGFPILGIKWQKMENPVLRMSVGMRPDEKGIRVRGLKPSAQPSAPESQLLKPSDVILSFDEVNIASDGTVPFRHGERIDFSYLVSQKYIGDNAPVIVLRNFVRLAFNIKLAKHKELIPSHIEGKPPSFYIIAGFVFTVLSLPYLLSEFGNISDVPNKLLDKHLHAMAQSIDDQPGVVQSIDEQIVLVSQVLAADINTGYEGIANKQVHTFNGMPVKNLKSLASMVENCNDKYLMFGLECNQLVVLETKPDKAATLDILTTHGIPSSMSDDLKTQESTSEGVHSMTDDLRGMILLEKVDQISEK